MGETFLTTEDTESAEEEELVCCYENHRFDSLGELRSLFEKTLTSKLADAFAKRLPAWQANRKTVFLQFLRKLVCTRFLKTQCSLAMLVPLL